MIFKPNLKQTFKIFNEFLNTMTPEFVVCENTAYFFFTILVFIIM